MNEKKINREKALNFLWLLLIFSSIIFTLAKEQNNGDIISFLRLNLIFIFILVIPIVFWLIFLIKGNEKETLILFLKKHLFNYISKFISLIIASYLVYFVFINHTGGDFLDILIVLFLFFLAFILFLFASWFGEIKFPELSKKRLVDIGKFIIKDFSFVLIPLLFIFLINYFVLSLNPRGAIIIAFIYTMGLVISISPPIKGRIKRVLSILYVLITFSFITIWGSKIGIFGIETRFSIYYSIISGIIILLLFIVSPNLYKKVWFKRIIKNSSYDLDKINSTIS